MIFLPGKMSNWLFGFGSGNFQWKICWRFQNPDDIVEILASRNDFNPLVIPVFSNCCYLLLSQTSIFRGKRPTHVAYDIFPIDLWSVAFFHEGTGVHYVYMLIGLFHIFLLFRVHLAVFWSSCSSCLSYNVFIYVVLIICIILYVSAFQNKIGLTVIIYTFVELSCVKYLFTKWYVSGMLLSVTPS